MGCGNLVVEPNTGACYHLETSPDWDVWVGYLSTNRSEVSKYYKKGQFILFLLNWVFMI